MSIIIGVKNFLFPVLWLFLAMELCYIPKREADEHTEFVAEAGGA